MGRCPNFLENEILWVPIVAAGVSLCMYEFLQECKVHFSTTVTDVSVAMHDDVVLH